MKKSAGCGNNFDENSDCCDNSPKSFEGNGRKNDVFGVLVISLCVIAMFIAVIISLNSNESTGTRYTANDKLNKIDNYATSKKNDSTDQFVENEKKSNRESEAEGIESNITEINTESNINEIYPESRDVNTQSTLDYSKYVKANFGEEYYEIPIRFCSASSQLDENYPNNDKYNPNNVCDGDLHTAYVEGVTGNGIGEMLKMDFEGVNKSVDSYIVSKIEIFPGYQKDKKTFINNSRPSKVEFHFADGTIVESEFDYNGMTSGSFMIDLEKLDHRVVSHDCIVKITDAIPGSKYDDCCISEIKIYTKNPTMSDEILLKTNVDYEDDNFYLTAYKSGNEIWSKVIPFNDDYDLVGVQYITSANDKVFIINEYKLEALDIKTGEIVWRDSSDIGMAMVGSCFDIENEILYLTGWDGPADVLAYDMDGNLLFTDRAKTDAYWPYMMTLNRDNNALDICFDSDSIIVPYYLKK